MSAIPLEQCPKGPVLLGDQLYIYCDIEILKGDGWGCAHLIRCRDWEYVTFSCMPCNDEMPGHVPAHKILATPCKIEVVKQ